MSDRSELFDKMLTALGGDAEAAEKAVDTVLGPVARSKSGECLHRRMVSRAFKGVECADCGADLSYLRGCSHRRIDNETWRCVECGEQMVSCSVKSETVLSAPNLAACTNPACVAALADNTYDSDNPPVGCTNTHGFYVPDRSREREVVIGWDYTYECERCGSDGDTYIAEGIVWDCGHSHHGDRVPVKESADS